MNVASSQSAQFSEFKDYEGTKIYLKSKLSSNLIRITNLELVAKALSISILLSHMEYDCYAYSKYLAFQMKNLIF